MTQHWLSGYLHKLAKGATPPAAMDPSPLTQYVADAHQAYNTPFAKQPLQYLAGRAGQWGAGLTRRLPFIEQIPQAVGRMAGMAASGASKIAIPSAAASVGYDAYRLGRQTGIDIGNAQVPLSGGMSPDTYRTLQGQRQAVRQNIVQNRAQQ